MRHIESENNEMADKNSNIIIKIFIINNEVKKTD